MQAVILVSDLLGFKEGGHKGRVDSLGWSAIRGPSEFWIFFSPPPPKKKKRKKKGGEHTLCMLFLVAAFLIADTLQGPYQECDRSV